MPFERKGFNKYTINGEETIIHIENTKGQKFEVLIDTEDLQRLIDLDYSWHTVYHKYTRDYYVRSTVYDKTGVKTKVKMLYLHNFLMDCPDGYEVDHIVHNTLNNKKNNLRITPKQHNDRNRKGRNSNNKSGYRNVCWLKPQKAWVVQLQLNGKNERLGLFDDVHEAGKYAEKMRQKYYGDFAGNG